MTVEDLEQIKIRPSRASADATEWPDEKVAKPVDDVPEPATPPVPVVPSAAARPRRFPALRTRPALPALPAFPALRARLASRPARFAIAFAVGVAATLLLLSAVAVAAFSASSGRVVAGVHVGSVDLSGLSRDQAVARLQATYGYLSQGDASVNTPAGAASITYAEAGRSADVDSMADAAMSVGHSGNPFGDAAVMLKSAIGGDTIPVVVRVDPTAIAKSVHALVGTNDVPAKDAGVTNTGGTFTLTNSAVGSGIDEKAVSAAILGRLSSPDAPSHLRIDESFFVLEPTISDEQAQAAIAAAPKMAVSLSLTWTGPTPSTTTTSTTTTFQVDAQTVAGWITFGVRADGTYGPYADSALVKAYLSGLSGQVGTAPEEPIVVHDGSGRAVSLSGGKDGTGIDQAATSQAIVKYLAGLASGGTPTAAVAMVEGPIRPTTTLDSLKGTLILGAWSTMFTPDLTNGNGANIRVPAALMNGIVVAPGEQFSFLKAMGPIDKAHGFEMGGMIASGKSNHLGAIGGGICSASTTLFNAVLRAGLQIDERHAHFFYIDRYPIGLDATVFVSGSEVMELKWTNDTPNPIVIRAYTTYGKRSTIVVQLWSQPLDRTVTLSTPYQKNLIPATSSTQYTTKLAPGIWGWAELPRDGFDTARTRTVTDSTGKVIHKDTWISKYIKVDGLKLIGKAI